MNTFNLSKHKPFLYLNLLFAMLVLFKQNCSAQKVTKIEIIQANTLEYDEKLGNARRLIGDVQFKQDGTLMYCDSAYLYSETNTVKAFGNIHLNQADSIHLYGDSLNYFGNNKKASVFGNVKLIDKSMELSSSHLDYDLKENIAYYPNGGKIINSKDKNTLTSKQGYYHTNSKLLFFKDSVILINPQLQIQTDTLKFNTVTEIAFFHGPTHIIGKKDFIYCENGWYNTKKDIAQFQKNAYLLSENKKLKGDSLAYNRNLGIGKAIKNVSITDTVSKIIISGDLATHNEKTNVSHVTGNLLLTLIMENDSLFLHADTLLAVEDTTSKQKNIFAYHKVKFFKKDLSGSCDSLIYNMTDSLIKMYKEPILWNEENQMTSEFITIKTFDGKIEHLEMDNSAFIVSMSDSLKYNQIRGKNMFAEFNNNQLSKVNVYGNGQTLYYAKEENGDYFGLNKAECSDLIIYVKDKTIDKLTFLNKPDATLYPINQLTNEERFLKGFKWMGHLKPKSKEDIF